MFIGLNTWKHGHVSIGMDRHENGRTDLQMNGHIDVQTDLLVEWSYVCFLGLYIETLNIKSKLMY